MDLQVGDKIKLTDYEVGYEFPDYKDQVATVIEVKPDKDSFNGIGVRCAWPDGETSCLSVDEEVLNSVYVVERNGISIHGEPIKASLGEIPVQLSNNNKENNNMENSNLPAKLKDVSQDLMYKLRLSKLDPNKRILQEEGAIDEGGFLTPMGSMAYLDYLWQNDTEGQKELASALKSLKKDKKKDCK